MAKNDQELAARKIVIDELTVELNRMLPAVLAETGIKSNLSLNALYGGKFADYINIKDEIIHSPDHFVSIYLDGFLRKANDSREGSAHKRNLALLRASPRLQEYLYIFLKRVYLRNFDALSKKRPPVEEAVIWAGSCSQIPSGFHHNHLAGFNKNWFRIIALVYAWLSFKDERVNTG